MKDTLIQINSYGMGMGDKRLALILIQKYLELITEEEQPPSFIVFYNEGVKLLSKHSPILEILENLKERGTKLIACSTCINHLDLKENLAIGIAGSMSDIINLQKKAQKIITL